MIDFDALVPVRQLGFGTTCEVMLVEVPGRGTAALKRALANRRADPLVQKLLVEEGRVAALLVHPSIPRLLARGETAKDGAVLLFEHVDGATLDDALPKKAKLDVDTACFVVDAVLDALGCAHDLIVLGRPVPIVHRDVGPHNVVVARSGDAVLIDFGVAVAADRERWTAGGALRGALSYIAPEAADGADGPSDVDGRADLFAAGVLLHRLLTGRSPFAGKGPMQVLEAARAGAFSRPSLHVVEAAPLDEVVAGALAPDRGVRWGSAAAMRTAIAAAVPMDDRRRRQARARAASLVAPLLPQDGAARRTLT